MGRHCVVSEHRKLRGDGKRRTTLESPESSEQSHENKNQEKKKENIILIVHFEKILHNA